MSVSNIFDVKDNVVLVTGAASGLGLAMSTVLAENGARVVMADVDAAGLERECGKLRAGSNHAEAEAKALDIGDVKAVHATLDDIVARYGKIDTVFANAGVTSGPGFGTPQGQIENVDYEVWDRALRVNLTGTFATMQAAATHMKKRRQGSIVCTASIAALKVSPLPGHAYHATKAAVAHLVRLLALELGPFNVRVNGIAPGPFVTNIAGGRMRDPDAAKKFAATVPMGRLAHTDEIKGLALLLASPASSYITGALIPIDGGTDVM